MKEIWKNVPGYIGLQASNLGRIKALACITKHRGVGQRRLKERILVASKFSNNYLGICFNRNCKQTSLPVHRLVLLAFIGRPKPKQECAHNDGNRQNNQLDNLRWDTRKGNHRDKWKHGTQQAGEQHPMAKLTDEEVLKIRMAHGVQHHIGKQFHISQSTVHLIKTGKIWKHL